MRFAQIAQWLTGKTISRVEYCCGMLQGDEIMMVDEIHFTDGSMMELGGHGLLAWIEDVTTADGKTITPQADLYPELDQLLTPISTVIEDLPLDAPWPPDDKSC